MVKVIFIILALFTQSYSVILECKYLSEWWPKMEFKYSCVTTLSEVSTTQRLRAVNGEHEAGKNNSHVESIEFQGCTGSTFIPKDMLIFFPNLIAIRLMSCGSLILTGNELNEYENLQMFAVEMTKIERIPGNFFAFTPQISIIGFADNNLKYVGSKLLQTLNNLSWISFANNDCINQTATSLDEIPSLITNLVANCIDILEETTSTTFTSIMTSSAMTTEETTVVGETTTKVTNGCEGVKVNLMVVTILIILKFNNL